MYQRELILFQIFENTSLFLNWGIQTIFLFLEKKKIQKSIQTTPLEIMVNF